MKHLNLFSVIALFTCSLLCAAPAPIFETEFKKNEKGQVIDNINPNLPGKILGQHLHFHSSELSGTVEFTANPEDSITFPYNEKNDTPDQFTVTGWFKISQLPAKDAPSSQRCYSLVCRGWQFYVLLHANGVLEGNTHQLFSVTSQSGRIKIVPGQWYHYAYTYSAKTKYYQLYLNGILASQRNQNWKKNQPFIKSIKNSMSFGSVLKFWPCKGSIGRTRLYNRVLSAEEINASEQDLVRKQLLNTKAGLPHTEKGKAIGNNIDRLLKLPVIPISEIHCAEPQP